MSLPKIKFDSSMFLCELFCKRDKACLDNVFNILSISYSQFCVCFLFFIFI